MFDLKSFSISRKVTGHLIRKTIVYLINLKQLVTILIFLEFLISCNFLSYSQTDSSDVLDIEHLMTYSLEELLKVKVNVSSSEAKSIRETPGIVTVITEEEIMNSGARDFIDIMRFVPGFEITGDIDNNYGLSVRGNYASDGKYLVLIDGVIMNETGYGTATFGNRILPDNIKKIEIIRGPGSTIYGGFAEFAVFNIITKDGKDLDGIQASVTGGVSEGEASRSSIQVGMGKKFKNDLDLSLKGDFGVANRSNSTYHYATNYYDYNGSSGSFNYADSSKSENINVNLGLKYKSLSLTGIYQNNLNDHNTVNADYLRFGGVFLGTKYKWGLSKNVVITPQYTFKKDIPWNYVGNLSEDYEQLYVNDNYRHTLNINGLITLSNKIKVMLGGECYHDLSKKPSEDIVFESTGKNRVQYVNYAAYSELSLDNKLGYFVLGARFDHHSHYGSAFVPRLAYTRVLGDFHVKALLIRAFKAPTIINIERNMDIKPEFLSVIELEVGYKWTDHLSTTGSVFYNYLDSPIIYYFDNLSNEETYLNYNHVSTIGVEHSTQLRKKWGYIKSDYSFYINNRSDALPYQIEGNSKLLRALPAHKWALTTGFYLKKKLTIAPNFIFTTKKISYYYTQEYFESYEPIKTPANFIFNFISSYKLNKHLKLTLGIYDLFNQKFYATNAYDVGYPGTPTMGREFTLKLSTKF